MIAVSEVVVGIACAAATAMLLLGCGERDSPSPRAGSAPHDARVVDERIGTYRGVGLGDARSEVRAQFGDAPPWTETSSVEPLDARSVTAPQSYSCPGAAGESFMRYDGVSFGLAGDEVCQVLVSDPSAETLRGIGIGDPWARASEAYPELRCELAEITGEHRRRFRFCAGRTGADNAVFLWLGGDPVDTMMLTTRFIPLAGVP